MNPSDIAKLFNPGSVAILGATEGANRVGGRVMRYMLEGGFAGPVYPVNPTRETVQGVAAYASVDAIPGSVDCAILALPAEAVMPSLDQCAAIGVKSAVVFSSGFAEMGAEGRRLQDELGRAARAAGIKLLGPNCLGIANSHSGFYASFSSNFLDGLPQPGSVAVVSQSGAFGAHLYTLARARGIGITYSVTTGNEVDTTISECLAYLATAPEVNTIMLYAEGINDADGLRRAMALARDNRKPVIVTKVGRSEVGIKAAASHTASLAVSDAVCDALFRQYGAHRVSTTDEMIEIAYAAQMGIFPTGRGIGIISMSGGVGVQMADRATDCDMAIPELPAAARAELQALTPMAVTANPVDLTAAAMSDPAMLETSFRILLNEPCCDAVASFLTPVMATPEMTADLTACFDEMRESQPNKPIALCLPASTEIKRAYEAKGYTLFDSPDWLISGFAALAGFGEAFARGAGTPPAPLPPGAEPVPTHAVDEVAAKRILKSAGLPTVRECLAATAEDAAAFAAGLGRPVALKIASADILHKTEIGGVLLNVAGADAVAQGFTTLVERAKAARPEASIDGVVVSEMVEDSIETVIGVNLDPTFGPVVMFGLGGIFVEVLGDVTFRLAPFGRDEAHRMIREIRGFEVLTGARGGPVVDLEALAAALEAVSVFAAANAERLESLDINPFLVGPWGGAAVDALIVPRS